MGLVLCDIALHFSPPVYTRAPVSPIALLLPDIELYLCFLSATPFQIEAQKELFCSSCILSS